MKLCSSILFVVLLMLIANAAHAWEVDFSRRQSQMHKDTSAQDSAAAAQPQADDNSGDVNSNSNVSSSDIGPAPAEVVSPPGQTGEKAKSDKHWDKSLDGLVKHRALETHVYDRQEVVILNTPKGFVPAAIRLHKGVHYLVHVVNVNEGQKNVSFMLDAFNQHYSTYFGQLRSFNLDPDREGTFEFECPETASIGKVIVYGPSNAPAQVDAPLTAEHHDKTTYKVPARGISSEQQ